MARDFAPAKSLEPDRGHPLPVSPARQTAFDVLLKVESGRRFAVELLQSAKVSALTESDRRLATEIVMGVLRRRGELDFQIERLAKRAIAKLDREVQVALRMVIYHIQFLDRIPKSAVVNDAVELV